MSKKTTLFYAFCARGCIASHVESEPPGQMSSHFWQVVAKICGISIVKIKQHFSKQNLHHWLGLLFWDMQSLLLSKHTFSVSDLIAFHRYRWIFRWLPEDLEGFLPVFCSHNLYRTHRQWLISCRDKRV